MPSTSQISPTGATPSDTCRNTVTSHERKVPIPPRIANVGTS